MKQLLEQGQQQRLEVKETLLQTLAVIGQHTHSPSAQLLVLAVLVGRLDDPDPGIRSFAAQLLLGKRRSPPYASFPTLLALGQQSFCPAASVTSANPPSPSPPPVPARHQTLCRAAPVESDPLTPLTLPSPLTPLAPPPFLTPQTASSAAQLLLGHLEHPVVCCNTPGRLKWA